MVATADRKAWLDWRREGVGASETPALFGLDPFKTRLDVWCDKVLPADSRDNDPPSEPAEIGLLLEDAIATLYERRTGRKVERRQDRVVADFDPIIRATLDGADSEGVVELKSVGHPHANLLGEPGTDEIPPWWIVQVQQQMLCAGAPVAHVAALKYGREFAIYRVERDEDLISLIKENVSLFWDQYVRTKSAPDPDLPADAKHLARIFSGCHGDVELTAETLAIVGEWLEVCQSYRDANAAAEAVKDRRDILKAEILKAFGSAKLAALPDGRFLERAIRTRKAHEVKESSWVELKVRTPKGVTV